MTVPRRPTYATVQLLRGIAASAVVVFHLLPFEQKYLGGRTFMPDWLVAGQAGVDVFFVISGFIVTTVTAGHAGRVRESLSFLVRRFWRIYPTYWVYYAALVAVYLVAPGLMNHRETGAPSLLDSFLLLPSAAPPLLLVAWTLSFELYFYLVFAVLLCVIPRARLAPALLVWSALVVVGRLLLPVRHAPLADLMFDPLNLEFIAGCGIALWVPHARRSAGLALIGGAIVGGLLLVLCVGAAAPFQNAWLRVGVFGSAAALLVAGCTAWETPGVTRLPRPLLRLGDASYSLYLSHLLTIGAIGVVWRYAARMPALVGADTVAIRAIALASAFAASVGVGWMSFRLIEAPLIAVMKGVGRRGPRAALAPGTAAAPIRASSFW